ncbi:hypothetical protein [Bacillus sp. NPDC094106]|uniref:hypothetical protein n=1 Tax=Bacillus sp. NPDC094106 TaxID=3363949 RepID=UPI003813E101
MVFCTIFLIGLIIFTILRWDDFYGVELMPFLMFLCVICIGLCYRGYKICELEDNRENVIAGKLDMNKWDIDFNHLAPTVYATTKGGEYKYVFKEGTAHLINWEKQDESKEHKNPSEKEPVKDDKNSDEKVRELIAGKLQIKTDEVVVTKDKNNLYTAITPSGKYIVETEENTVAIKAMVKQE